MRIKNNLGKKYKFNFKKVNRKNVLNNFRNDTQKEFRDFVLIL